MGGASSILKPQELTEFRKLNTTTENVEIPARPESRRLTDKKGFIIFGIGFLIFIAFFGYALAKSDIRRYLFGYDDCGNMCGLANPKIDGIPCSGKDYTFERYFISNQNSNDTNFFGHNYLTSKCVESCGRNSQSGFLGKCERIFTSRSFETFKNPYSNDGLFSGGRFTRDTSNSPDKEFDLDATLDYCRTQWWRFLVSILITIALCMVVLFLLRYVPGILIWGVLIIGLLGLIILTCGSWYSYFSSDRKEKTGELVGSIIISIITLIIVIIFFVLFKKIRLVVQLYKEATKAVFAMPLLTMVPVLMMIFQIIILIGFLASTVWLFTSRELKKHGETKYQYEFTGVMGFTIAFNFIMTSWAMHFIAGFQYLIVSGSIAAWYFAKNKQYLDSPICTSFLNAFKFHAGTVALGSSILTIMDVIRALIRAFFDNNKSKWILECCCSNIEAFLKFLSKNAYIETAIHGQSFLRSGKRAAKLLLTNAASVIAINSVGDFVLGMIILILVIISTAISTALFKDGPNFWLPSFICFIVNTIIIAITFAIFETTIDTLFICFCEDKVLNDGISKPYFMSRGLMEFVENSKKIYPDKNH